MIHFVYEFFNFIIHLFKHPNGSIWRKYLVKFWPGHRQWELRSVFRNKRFFVCLARLTGATLSTGIGYNESAQSVPKSSKLTWGISKPLSEREIYQLCQKGESWYFGTSQSHRPHAAVTVRGPGAYSSYCVVTGRVFIIPSCAIELGLLPSTRTRSVVINKLFKALSLSLLLIEYNYC